MNEQRKRVLMQRRVEAVLGTSHAQFNNAVTRRVLEIMNRFSRQGGLFSNRQQLGICDRNFLQKVRNPK